MGKDAVVEAILEAATALFTEKAPSRVGVREIAAHAGVNHGLVHRHFGSKSNLVQAVLARNDARIREAAAGEGDFAQTFTAVALAALGDRNLWRIPAHLILDDEAELLQSQDSFLRVLREAAAAEYGASSRVGLTADEQVFLLITLGLGIQMFGDYVSAAMDMDKPELGDLVGRLLAVGRESLE